MLTHEANYIEEHPNQKLLESILTLLFMLMINIDYKNCVNMVYFGINWVNCNKIVISGLYNQIFSELLTDLFQSYYV